MTWGTKNLPRQRSASLETTPAQHENGLDNRTLTGAWTNVTLTLKGVSPNNLKYLKIGIDMENVIFDSIQPINDTKKPKIIAIDTIILEKEITHS